MGPRCSSAEIQVCHRSYIIAANSLTMPPLLLCKSGLTIHVIETDSLKSNNLVVFYYYSPSEFLLISDKMGGLYLVVVA